MRIFPFRMLSQKARGEIGHTHLSSDVRLLFMSASLSALAFSSACSSLSWERCRFTSTDRSSRSRVCNHRRHDTKKKKKNGRRHDKLGEQFMPQTDHDLDHLQIYILRCRYEMLCRPCIVQIQPRKHVLLYVEHADNTTVVPT